MIVDRKLLGALALAQCASFAAVLVLAAFWGRGPSPSRPGPSPSPVISSPRVTSSSPVTSSPPASLGVTFTVTASAAPSQKATSTATPKATPTATPKATPTATGTLSPSSFQNTPVVTLDARTLKPVASGHLNSKDSAAETVPANHSYLVCLSPPQGWESAGDTYRLPGWICARLSAVVTGQTVSFALRSASSSGSGSTG